MLGYAEMRELGHELVAFVNEAFILLSFIFLAIVVCKLCNATHRLVLLTEAF